MLQFVRIGMFPFEMFFLADQTDGSRRAQAAITWIWLVHSLWLWTRVNARYREAEALPPWAVQNVWSWCTCVGYGLFHSTRHVMDFPCFKNLTSIEPWTLKKAVNITLPAEDAALNFVGEDDDITFASLDISLRYPKAAYLNFNRFCTFSCTPRSRLHTYVGLSDKIGIMLSSKLPLPNF